MRIRNALKLARPTCFLVGAALFSSFAPLTSAQDVNDLNPPGAEDIPDGFMLIDGDMLFPKEFTGKTAAGYNTNFWPGVVPYEFDGNVTAGNQAAMISAMGLWQAVANVRFVPRAVEFNYVHIQSSTGNNSAVGMVGGVQLINIVSWGSQYIMAHELGHCLGYIHEHQRPDRNSFVSINTGNIQGGFGNQLSQMNGPLVYGPYDFDSLMHYDGCSFSVCCPPGATCNCAASCQTITVLPPFNAAWQTNIGQRTHLSYWDQLVMSFAYPQSNWRFQRSSFGNDLFFPGTFVFPFGSFSKGYDETPPGGTLWLLEPSSFAVGPVLDKRMTIAAPLGGVILNR